MKITTVVVLMVGGVLIYSAVKDQNPLDVFKSGLSGKAAPVPQSQAKGEHGGPGINFPVNPNPGQTITSV